MTNPGTTAPGEPVQPTPGPLAVPGQAGPPPVEVPADRAGGGSAPPPGARVHTRLRHIYRHHVDYRARAALIMWLAFAVTFGIARAITYGIHHGLVPNTNVVTSSGLHIHHFVFGIGLVLISGFLSVTINSPRWHPWLAAVFGVGAALIIDEFAIWLNLRDVYWSHQGQVSVEIAVAVITLLGLYWAADRFWHEIAGEAHRMFRRRGGRRADTGPPPA